VFISWNATDVIIAVSLNLKNKVSGLVATRIEAVGLSFEALEYELFHTN